MGRLVELSQGSLEVHAPQAPGQRFLATITLPARERIPVLVVDDNADTRQLLQRYLSDTRYRFEGAADADRALEMAEAVSPQVIILDLMLPTVDGWELLGRLRQRNCTRDVPILVCSILPLGRLAATLGATGFLQKPVSREDLLAALDHHLGLQRTGSG